MPPDPSPAAMGTRRGLPVLTWAALERAGVDAVCTTTAGGVSEGPYASLNLGLHVGDAAGSVLENRRRAARALDAALEDCIYGQQVHGDGVVVVGADDRGRGAHDAAGAVPGCDALVTTAPGVVLVVLVADCVPVVLADPHAGVLATVHAGWRGVVAGVVRRAVDEMGAMGAGPGATLAALGPAVDPARYPVGPEVVAAVRGALGTAATAVLAPGPGEGARLDVRGAVRRQLLEAGIPGEAVHEAPWSTADARFYSDRASRPCGRFGVLARLR